MNERSGLERVWSLGMRKQDHGRSASLKKSETVDETSTSANEARSWAELVKARPTSIALWLKYAEHEARAHGAKAARKVLREALRTRDLYRQPAIWNALITRYQSSHKAALETAREAVLLLPRCAELWELYTKVRYFPHEWAAWVDIPPDVVTGPAAEPLSVASHFEGEWLATLTKFNSDLNEMEQVYECWASTVQLMVSEDTVQPSSPAQASERFAAVRSESATSNAAENIEDPVGTVLLRGARRLKSIRLWKHFLERALPYKRGDDQALLEEALGCVPTLRTIPWFRSILRERRERWVAQRETTQLIQHVQRFPHDADAWLMLSRHYLRQRGDETESDAILMAFMTHGLAQASDSDVGRFLAAFMARIWSRTKSIAQVRALMEQALTTVQERAARDAIYHESLRFERYTLEDHDGCRALFRRWLSEAPHLASVWAAWAQFEHEDGVPAYANIVLELACDLFHAALVATKDNSETTLRQRQMLQILALWKLRMEYSISEWMEPAERRQKLLPLYAVLLQRYPASLAVATSFAAFEALTDDQGLDRALEFLRQKRLDEAWSIPEQARMEQFTEALKRTTAVFHRSKRARLWEQRLNTATMPSAEEDTKSLSGMASETQSRSKSDSLGSWLHHHWT
jgi:tetratricopeptide (TPR) repeat protein